MSVPNLESEHQNDARSDSPWSERARSFAAFGGAEHALHYLGRYTHRVAISNDRLVYLDEGQIMLARFGA